MAQPRRRYPQPRQLFMADWANRYRYHQRPGERDITWLGPQLRQELQRRRDREFHRRALRTRLLPQVTPERPRRQNRQSTPIQFRPLPPETPGERRYLQGRPTLSNPTGITIGSTTGPPTISPPSSGNRSLPSYPSSHNSVQSQHNNVPNTNMNNAPRISYRRFGIRRRYRRTGGYKPTVYGPNTAELKLAQRYLHVFRNPFSNASLTPRIPDGKAITSQGLKFQMRKPITFNYNDDLAHHIWLQPNLHNPCTYIQQNTSNDAINFDPFVNSQITSYNITSAGGTQTFVQPENSAIHKWRVVSYGLHVTMLNNTDSNDGWWEAVRVNTKTSPLNYFAEWADGEQVCLYPDENKQELSESSITNLPSYTTGRLRDIHNITFSLHPDGCEHDFNEIRNPSLYVEDNGSTRPNSFSTSGFNDPASITEFGDNSAKSEFFFRGQFDPNYDTILLKIYPRDTTQTSVGSGTQLLVHVVQNVEIVYDDRAINARFHTRTPIHSGFERASRNKANKPHAAEAVKKRKQ